jgi:Spy/CpxP family protein refolding chaperone
MKALQPLVRHARIAAVIGVFAIVSPALAAEQQKNDTATPAERGDAGGYGPGYGWGPGMMGGYGMGPGMMGGYGWGPGMMGGYGMGPGMMGGYGMGPGMMGGYGWGPGMMGGYGMGPGMMGGYGWGRYGGATLSDSQRSQINKIADEVRKSHWAIMGKMMDEQSKLRDLLSAPKRDQAAIDRVYKNLGELQQAMYQTAIDAHKRIEAVLTKEQREQPGSKK